MTSATNPSTALTPFPDHTQLPESDGTFLFAERAGGKNWQELKGPNRNPKEQNRNTKEPIA
jgi:hypothetical protein